MYSDPFINSMSLIVNYVLDVLKMNSPEALDLVMRTGMQESRFKYLEQLGGGPGLGFFQVEPGTADDTWYNYVVFREGIRDDLKTLGLPMGPWQNLTIMSNIALQVALCRLKYRRWKAPIPLAIEEQAAYYKQIYNTPKGKATAEEFISNAKELERLKRA